MRRSLSMLSILALTAGCHPPIDGQRLDEDADDQSPAPSAENGDPCDLDLETYAIDVRCDDFGVTYKQTPGMADPDQKLSWYGYGCGHDGEWQGEGCFPALPYFDARGEFTGVDQSLPDDGLFRLGCGVTNGVDAGAMDPDSAAWCNHAEGVDTDRESKWTIQFQECGVVKTNLCIERIEGVSYPNEARCFAQYVPPPHCP